MLRDMHGGFRSDVDALTQEQFVHQPAEGANTAAFLLWHPIRFEDNMLAQQAGQEPLWAAEKWNERLGLADEDLGTGFTEDQVKAFAPAKEDLMAYAEAVWERTPGFLEPLTSDRLDIAPNPERPRMTVGRSLANFVVGHGWLHLGELRFVKGLMGMPFAR